MKSLKKIMKWTGIVLLVVGIIAAVFYFMYVWPFMKKLKITHTINYDKELILITGGGGNSGILVSDSLVLVVDTKMDQAATDLYDKEKQLAGSKPVLVVNTHFHPDHVGGNSLYEGSTVLAGAGYSKDDWRRQGGEASLPTRWLKDKLVVPMGNDTATIFTFGMNAHTEGDVFVYLHRRKLLFGGDVILNKQNTIIMGKGDAYGYLEAFKRLQQEFDIEHVVQ